jgi:hypothetical protein
VTTQRGRESWLSGRKRLPSPIPSVPDPAVQEVITLTVLPGRRYPDLINDDDEKSRANSFVVPDAALADSGLHDLALEAQG